MMILAQYGARRAWARPRPSARSLSGTFSVLSTAATSSVGSMHPPTDEQARVIESFGDVKVNAVAGSGKTATLMRYAAARPNERILYLSFNKSVQEDAEHKFTRAGISNVDVKTAHSLAYQGIKHKFGGRIDIKRGTYRPHDVKSIVGGLDVEGGTITKAKLNAHVLKLAALYCNSEASSLDEVDYSSILTNVEEVHVVSKHIDMITSTTKRFLDKMGSGEIASTHDFYLKQYQLSSPSLKYDTILFDEGQDASPAMLDVLMRQSAKRVVVGDEHQQIYGFRHAVNAMEKIDFPSLPLSTSFRFGQEIAKLATEIIRTKRRLSCPSEPFVVPIILGRGSSSAFDSTTHAILGRTNAALLRNAIDIILEEKNRPRVYFENNFNSYGFKGGQLYDVLNLYLGNLTKIRDKTIKDSGDIIGLTEFASATEDLPLLGRISTVKKYGSDLFGLVESLKEQVVDSKAEAELIFSIVHKAKGMEYDEVTLLGDFHGEERLPSWTPAVRKSQIDFYKEEVNIAYVAATRAKRKLNIPRSVLPRKLCMYEDTTNQINIV